MRTMLITALLAGAAVTAAPAVALAAPVTVSCNPFSYGAVSRTAFPGISN